MTRTRKTLLAAVGAAIVLAGGLICITDAQAQCYSFSPSYGYGRGSGYGGYGYGYNRYGGGYGMSRPIWHGPSVHLDRVYHREYSHWTPHRGFHSHGHYDRVPHFVPGHFDFLHGNQIHTNPRHHR